MDGYPHTLNRHDVGWELPRPTNRQDSQPASHKGRVVESETTTTRKERLEGGETEPAHDGNEPFGPPWRRVPATPQDGFSASELADLPGFTSHASVHPSSIHPLPLFWCRTTRRRQPTKLAHADPPPSPPIPTSKGREKTPPSRRPPDKPPTHPPGISSTRTKEKKKRGCGIARQQTDKGGWGALEPRKPLVPSLAWLQPRSGTRLVGFWLDRVWIACVLQ